MRTSNSISPAPAVSVVIPIGPRMEDLAAICGGLRRALNPLAVGYEVILVDEASNPQTRAKIRAVGAQFPEVRIIRLQRQMGESATLATGVQAARGERIITLDPYLHIALDDLPKLLAPLNEGMDLVCA